MPELPEVETIKEGLQKTIVGCKITDIFALWDGIIKDMSFQDFRKEVIGKKITDVKRRAKNLFIILDSGKIIVIHFKMTGHALLVPGAYKVDKNGFWSEFDNNELLKDPQNQFIRIIFHLSDGKQLAISDLRKFAYIKLFSPPEYEELVTSYGPEPLEKSFTFDVFKSCLKPYPKKLIKKILMEQDVIAGIGNIYADEALFYAGIYPERRVGSLNDSELKLLYNGIREILQESLKLRGTSTSDFRDITGRRGGYGDVRQVYRREGEPCQKCGAKIKRIKLGGRSAHFCPNCQK